MLRKPSTLVSMWMCKQRRLPNATRYGPTHPHTVRATTRGIVVDQVHALIRLLGSHQFQPTNFDPQRLRNHFLPHRSQQRLELMRQLWGRWAPDSQLLRPARGPQRAAQKTEMNSCKHEFVVKSSDRRVSKNINPEPTDTYLCNVFGYVCDFLIVTG
jgi:hypothetical protein